MVIEPIERASVAEEITDRLRSMILRGHLAAGSRLPAERELADRFGTNRNTLREALRTLEAQGLVAVRQGAASEVLDFRESGNLMLLPFFLREAGFGPALAETVRDLYALRREFVVLMARAAAGQTEPERRAAVEQAAAEVAKRRGDTAAVAAADIGVYRSIVAASRSVVYLWVYNTFAPIFDFLARHAPEGFEFPDDYYAGIARMAAAIAEGRPEDAARATQVHLERMDGLSLSLLDMLTSQAKETP